MVNRNNLERQLRRRHQRRMAELNRNSNDIFGCAVKFALLTVAVVIGICVWWWAAGKQAEEEAFAATLRRTRLIKEEMFYEQVPPLPEVFPEDGEPPQAIEIKMASKADAVPTISEMETVAEESSDTESWESMGVYQLTFYCPCYQCSEGWGHQTASGARAVEGITIAADPSVPFGTHLLINGHEYIVQDRGGSIKGRKIDVFMESHSECLKNGIQKAEVFIKR